RLARGARAGASTALCPGADRALSTAQAVKLAAGATLDRPAGAAADGPADAVIHGAAHAADAPAERPAEPAVRATAQDLRVSGSGHSQHGCDRGAREKMMDLHGRLLSRPRPIRDPSPSTTTGRCEFFRGTGDFRGFDLMCPQPGERRLPAQVRTHQSIAVDR